MYSKCAPFPLFWFFPPIKTATADNVSPVGVLPFADHPVVPCESQGKNSCSLEGASALCSHLHAPA